MYFWSRKLPVVDVACENDGGNKFASSLAKVDPGTKGEGLGSGDVEGKVEVAKNGWACLSETSWLVFLRNGPRIGSSIELLWNSSMTLSLTRRLEPALSGWPRGDRVSPDVISESRNCFEPFLIIRGMWFPASRSISSSCSSWLSSSSISGWSFSCSCSCSCSMLL